MSTTRIDILGSRLRDSSGPPLRILWDVENPIDACAVMLPDGCTVCSDHQSVWIETEGLVVAVAPTQDGRRPNPLPGNDTLSRTHINNHVLRANRRDGGERPVITTKRGKENVYGHRATVSGPCRLVYAPSQPLSCGAQVWVESRTAAHMDVVELV